MDIVIKAPADIEVIKHRIYEVRGLRLKSQIVTSSLEKANIENNTRFVVENFDRKVNFKESKWHHIQQTD